MRIILISYTFLKDFLYEPKNKYVYNIILYISNIRVDEKKRNSFLLCTFKETFSF